MRSSTPPRLSSAAWGPCTRLEVTEAEPQWHLGGSWPGAMVLTAHAGLHVVDALRGGATVSGLAARGLCGQPGRADRQAQGSRRSPAPNRGQGDLAAAGRWCRRVRPPLRGKLDAHLHQLAPDGIDVYFDSVGGCHLEAALDHLNRAGRVALCRSISEYESAPMGPRNLFLAVSKDLTLRGFRGSSNLHLLPEMQRQIAGWLRTGDLVRPRDRVRRARVRTPRAGGDDRRAHHRKDAGQPRLTRERGLRDNRF